MTCPKCKYQNLHGANFCEKCGLDLKAAARAAANPVPTPVQPYGYTSGYGSGYGSSGYGGSSSHGSTGSSYTPSPRPTPSPKPMPAQRGGYQPAPPVTPAAPPAPVAPIPEAPSRGGRISAPPTPPTPIATPEPPRRAEPLPFGRLISDTGAEFPLRYDDNLIGRASEGTVPAVDLTAADASGSVSRRHARIGKDDSSVYVEDLGSSNGSRLNGQPLRSGMQAPLNDGDVVLFGSLQFRYHKIS